jgi:hypothetical protein
MKKDEEHTQVPKEEPGGRAGEEDIVDKTLEDSFPASDPPAWTSSAI